MDRADVVRYTVPGRPQPVGWMPSREGDPGRKVSDMSDERRRPHRPAPYADLTALIDAAGGRTEQSRAEIAAATAHALVSAARGDSDPDRLVGLADSVGIDTLAELWRDCDPMSLPGVLWVLYLLRQWCRSHPDDVARLWRDGEPYAPADAVVAGVGEHADPDDIRRLADSVLGGAYRGDFAVALERAAAFFRVIAAGRREGPAMREPVAELALADRNERTATNLAAAARAWRDGTLR